MSSRFWIIVASFLLVITASVRTPAQQPTTAQYVYRLGTASGAKHPNGVLAEIFKQEVEKNSNDRISVQIFPNAQLGGELDLVNAVRGGQLDFYAGAGQIASGISMAVVVSELPFLFPDYAAARKVLDGEAGQMALKTLEGRGVKGFAWGEIGFRGLMTNRKPINSIADVKGMKIRVTENPLYLATWRAVGANPVPMAWPEVYTALQQGTIDGVDANYAGFIDAKHFEVAKYLAVTNHSYTGNLLLMNLAKFQALPPDLQKVIEEATKVAAGEARKTAKMIDEGAVDTMKRAGVTVTTPARGEFVTATRTVYDEFIPRIGVDIVTRARAALPATP